MAIAILALWALALPCGGERDDGSMLQLGASSMVQETLFGTNRLTRATAPETPLCELSQGCDVASLKGLTRIAPGGETSCLRAEKGAYEFVVRPADPKKLVLFLQGGGYCDNDATIGMCISDIDYAKRSSGLLLNTGPFSDSNPLNPFKSYSMVQALYCSGDLHVGETTWVSGRRQVGYLNLRAVLDWVKQNYGSVESLVIMGSSAGALGSYYWSPTIFKEISHEHSLVVLDSYAGVFPEHVAVKVMQSMKACTKPIFPAAIQDQCLEGTLEHKALLNSAISSNPKTIYSVIQSKEDKTQILFYNFWALLLKVMPVSPSQFLQQSDKLFESLAKNPNFVLFSVDGQQHCFDWEAPWMHAGTLGVTAGSPFPTPLLHDWVKEALQRSLGLGCVSTECSGACDPRLAGKTCAE